MTSSYPIFQWKQDFFFKMSVDCPYQDLCIIWAIWSWQHSQSPIALFNKIYSWNTFFWQMEAGNYDHFVLSLKNYKPVLSSLSQILEISIHLFISFGERPRAAVNQIRSQFLDWFWRYWHLHVLLRGISLLAPKTVSVWGNHHLEISYAKLWNLWSFFILPNIRILHLALNMYWWVVQSI